MNSSLTALNRSIKNYDEKIAEETRRLEAHTQAKRDEINRRLDAAKEAVAEADHRNKQVIEQKRNELIKKDEVKSKGQAAEGKRQQLQDRITECQTMINKCKEQEKNSLAPYGIDIKGVLQSISKTHWHGDTPIGPLGLYVKVKDQKWAPLLRAQLGNLMTSFACTHAKDRLQLKKILDQSKKYFCSFVLPAPMMLSCLLAFTLMLSSQKGIYSTIRVVSHVGMSSLSCVLWTWVVSSNKLMIVVTSTETGFRPICASSSDQFSEH